MLNPGAVPAIDDNETLARFCYYSRWIRDDKTIRQDAFMPPPSLDLSLTRHRQATSGELWNEGNRVANSSNRTLYGRADVAVIAFTSENLQALADPDLPHNPNHAVVINWPAEKALQKVIAMQVAGKAVYIPPP